MTNVKIERIYNEENINAYCLWILYRKARYESYNTSQIVY